MQIDIWSDVVCPFCYLGKHQLEKALEQFEHRDEVTVIYHSFELDPDAVVDNEMDVYDMLTHKYGMSRAAAIASNDQIAAQGHELGLDFHQEKMKLTNSFDAHRLIHFAKSHGKQAEMLERLYQACFSEGMNIGHQEQLALIAEELGYDAAQVNDVLTSNAFEKDVRNDEEYATQLGIRGVPFFVIDTQYAISGAQGIDNFVQALYQARELSQ